MFSNSSKRTPKIISHTTSGQNLEDKFMVDNSLKIIATIKQNKIIFEQSSMFGLDIVDNKKSTIDDPDDYPNNINTEFRRILNEDLPNFINNENFQFNKVTLQIIISKKQKENITYPSLSNVTKEEVENKIEELTKKLEKLQTQTSHKTTLTELIKKFNPLRTKKEQEQKEELSYTSPSKKM